MAREARVQRAKDTQVELAIEQYLQAGGLNPSCLLKVTGEQKTPRRSYDDVAAMLQVERDSRFVVFRTGEYHTLWHTWSLWHGEPRMRAQTAELSKTLEVTRG